MIHKLCLNKAVKQQQKTNKDFFLITKKPPKTQAAKYSIHEMKANLGCVAERICGEKAKNSFRKASALYSQVY